jgi:hypothetical protein
MDHSDLLSLVEDIGRGNVLDSEMLEGCSVAAHELDDMDEVMAAKVAAHVFQELYDHKVQTIKGEQADPDQGMWTGNVENFNFRIVRNEDGDLLVDFFSSPTQQ